MPARPSHWLSGLGLTVACLALQAEGPAAPRTVRVPEDHPTLQAAVDAARDDDTVSIAPGTYAESVSLPARKITLTARRGDQSDPAETVIDGGGADSVITVPREAHATVVGLTLRNGDDGVKCAGTLHLRHCRVTQTTDGIDSTNGRGTIRHCRFDHNRDDGVDLDKSSAFTVEDSVIEDNGDDGIEIRLHDYHGPVLEIVIRGNTIRRNKEDGIQLIDYPGKSDRSFRIERNVIVDNAMAGIGCMSDGKTKEDYRGADLPEPILLTGNTIAGNVWGLAGGDNVLAANNIFLRNSRGGLLKVDGESLAAGNLFWENGTDFESSHVDVKQVVRGDPKLDAEWRPASGSPCIDAGLTKLRSPGGIVLDLAAGSWSGQAPDLGALEFRPLPSP